MSKYQISLADWGPMTISFGGKATILNIGLDFMNTSFSELGKEFEKHSFVEIDCEIFSTVILSLPLIQAGQLSVSGERMCTVLVNRLED